MVTAAPSAARQNPRSPHPDALAAPGNTKRAKFMATIRPMKNPITRALIGASVLGLAGLASAQTPPASNPAKKALVERLLKLQQPGIEGLARQIAVGPLAQLMGQAEAALPARVAPDKQQAVAKEIQAEAKKYADEAVPVVRAAALKLAPSTVGSLLETEFTEDELKQIVALLESPAYIKFRDKSGEMEKALADKLIPDIRVALRPKFDALEKTIGKRLGVTEAPAAVPAKPAAK